MSKPEDMGTKVQRIKRPACASSRTKLDAQVTLTVTMPPVLKDWARKDVMSMVHSELQAIPEPKAPIGMKRIHAQSIWDRPTTKPKRSALNPRFAGDKERRLAMSELVKAFASEYRAALTKYIEGDEQATFPAGTWKMQRLFGVRTTAPPALAA